MSIPYISQCQLAAPKLVEKQLIKTLILNLFHQVAFLIGPDTVGENIIGAPKIRNNYGAI